MDEKIDEVIDKDSGQDDPPYDDDEKEMTKGRRLALFFSKFSWYNPHAEALDKYERASAGESDGESVNKPPKPPSLDLAWAQFEHVALGRYISNYNSVSKRRSYDNKHDARERAEPGETDYQTKLYPLRSSENDMADWGAGVGLYFQNLRVFATICFVAGLISLPNMLYYSSSDYSSSFDASQAHVGKYLMMQTSQACTNSEWRACPSCDIAEWKDLVPYPSDGFAVTKDESLMFLKQNDCDVRFREGLIMWITIIFVAVAVFWACYRQINMEIKYDEAEQSASDYSITVDNPPRDAYDPVEWKTFFESNFVSKDGDNVHATCVTVVLNNQILVDKLVRRKKLLLAMELNLMQGKTFDQYDLESAVVDSMPVARWKMLICRAKDGQLMKTEIDTITEEIKELQKEQYDVSQIFVTFEHEVSQRNVLEALIVAKSAIHLNKTDVHSENSGYLFRGKHLLSVYEPEYPSDIRWRDLNETFMKMFYQQACTYFITFIAIGVAAVIVYICAKLKHRLIQSYVITIMNFFVPLFITFLMNFEAHKTEGSFQASHYLKIGLFRWFNTVIVLTVITPFTHTLKEKDSLVSTVFGLYLSELTLIPLLNYLDIFGTLARHFYGPRAKNQRQMNLQFKGTKFHLADAYTGMSKLVFLCFWYANIFPAAYFLTALTLTVHYFSYKFAILRSYRAGPKIDTKLAFISRVFIFPVAVLFLFVQADYNWSSFPFDNVCGKVQNVLTDGCTSLDGKIKYDVLYSIAAIISSKKRPLM